MATEMNRNPQINIRLPIDLKDAVQKMAEDNKRSVNAEIVSVLINAVKKHHLEKTPLALKELSFSPEIIDDIAEKAAEKTAKILIENKNNQHNG
ncbi:MULTISPECIES: Arc family DNA-binding protein [unclassified Arsenophonus]|uniref:Arc family DNA-binding protein n=2 Tax=Arsenophonus TaxID=637 RepID=UPI002862EA32|nr:Arc family DNA-binding protein [Arsenophonus sp.]MDR5610500.1 Arc family DNA-binding protein [Arsenophonus sp.]MDR5615193.1 Arc family DNA-binding protein [Arsenophonus sp.]